MFKAHSFVEKLKKNTTNLFNENEHASAFNFAE